jgi:hypothetical protein
MINKIILPFIFLLFFCSSFFLSSSSFQSHAQTGQPSCSSLYLDPDGEFQDTFFFSYPHKRDKQLKIQHLNAFILHYHKLPSKKKSSSPEEQAFANWFLQWKTNNPQWLDFLSAEAQLLVKEKKLDLSIEEQHLQELDYFIFTHNKLPQTNASTPEERSLALWLSYLKSKKSSWFHLLKPQTQQFFLDHQLTVPIKEQRKEQLRLFILEKKTLPSRYAQDPLEKSLGLWFYKFQRKEPHWFQDLGLELKDFGH